jgi:hypothetical protein
LWLTSIEVASLAGKRSRVVRFGLQNKKKSEVVGWFLVGMANSERLDVVALRLHGVQEDPTSPFSKQASSLIVMAEL